MQPRGLDGIEPVTLAWQGTREDVHAVPALFEMRSGHIVEVCRAAKPRTRRGSGESFYNGMARRRIRSRLKNRHLRVSRRSMRRIIAREMSVSLVVQRRS